MKRVREFLIYGIAVTLALVSVSCNKSISDSELIAMEQSTLKNYLESHHITAQPTASGLYYLPTDTGTGIRPDTSDVVEFSYTLRLLSDKVVATNIDSVARANGLFANGVFFKPFKYRLYWWFPGLKEGFQLMREGAKATFIIPSDLAYGRAGASSLNIGAYTSVIFDIKFYRVIKDPIADEKAEIAKYVLDSIPSDRVIDINDSGVYHIIDIPGTGGVPSDQTTVTFIYQEKFLDGTIIANQVNPLSYTLMTPPPAQVLAGFDQAIRRMQKGESAWAIVPYKQAFGERPNVYDYVPAFATLVYYIKLENIQ